MRLFLLVVGSAVLGAAVTYFLVRSSSGARRREPGGNPVQPPAQEKRNEPESEDILEKMGEGVLILDSELTPTYANTAARDMLGFREAELPQRLPSEEILSVTRRALETGSAEQRMNVWFPLPMTLQVRVATLGDAGELLVVVQDVTEEILAQRVRREFVAHASHELKSPVASIQALAEAIQQAAAEDPAAAERFSKRMIRESSSLGRLVRDLLDLSRLEESIVAPADPANLSAVARKILEQIEPAAETKEMEIEEVITEDVWIKGDEEQLGMLIQNLLENAIRYTPSAGTVRLEVFRDGGHATVAVTDTGIGIPTEAHSRVFERFYRVDRARSRDRGGTGLGLAIVKHVAELHGGRVEVQSEIGAGSTFSAHLPALPEESPSIENVAS
jgi:signal transduction histidine kinase